MHLPKTSMRLRTGTSGSAAIEFGIIAPLLLLLLVGVVELGFGVHQAMQVQDAAEAGALYAGKHGWDQGGIAAAVVNATGAKDVTADPAPTLFCGCPSVSGIAEVTCSDTCPDGSGPGRYVRVSAAIPHTAILVGLLVPLPDTLRGQAVVRVQ